MFSLFGQLPREIQREILLHCPNSLPEIIRVSKDINHLVGDDIYKLFHIGPTKAEVTKYLGTQPSMYFKYLHDNYSLTGHFDTKLFLLLSNTTSNNYMCIIENIHNNSTIEHRKQFITVILQNNKILFDRTMERIDVDGEYSYDLKTEYEIYNQRTSFVNIYKQYAQSKIRGKLDQIYDQYQQSENSNLIFLFFYLNHNKAVFQNSETTAINYNSTYLTCYDDLQTDSNGVLTLPVVQSIRANIDNLYLEMLDIVEKL